MSTYTSEPGTRLAGRYRLEDQVAAGGGWALWKAIDEILARPVTVLTFAENFPRVREAVTAARAASRLTDSRLSQVFDVDDSGERAYVVMEWVSGESLGDMLSDGPLEPSRAAALVAEAAQAISAAHAAGLAHLCLVPDCLRWTPGGGVKITGLGIDAALTGAGTADDAEDPALADTRDLARLLYAGMTGYWPGQEATSLPPAPVIDGSLCSPRQVSAGVPHNLDAITCQALFQRPARNGSVITTPLELADALAQVAPPVMPSPPPYRADEAMGRGSETSRMPRHSGTAPDQRQEPPGWGYGPPERPGGGYRHAGGRGRRGAAAKALVSVVVVLVLAAAGAVVWTVSHSQSNGTPKASGSRSKSTGPSTASSVVLKPVGANAADNPGGAGNAIDKSPGTFWHSEFYLNNPVFGGLKKGTGLVLNMGTQVRLSQLQVQFGSICCANVQIGIGNSDSPSSNAGFTTVASSNQAANTTTFNTTSPAKGQYVLIWFTSLPAMAGSPSQYQAQIYNVVVRGSS
jgi:hypothetical protein